jgi:hypothetical protein
MSGFRRDPPGQDTPAGKNQGMRAIAIQNRQLQIAIEGRSRYWVPHECSQGLPHCA